MFLKNVSMVLSILLICGAVSGKCSENRRNSPVSSGAPNSKLSRTDEGRRFPSHWKQMVLDVVKFLVRNFLWKQWTPELAVKRLDVLKTSIAEYYAKQNLFGVNGYPRDKGIGFPSLEGAILSLAFLTFSVFLIDVIQSLLSRLRAPPATPAPTPAAAALLGRTLRNQQSPLKAFHPVPLFHDEDMISTLSSKILSAIEKPL